MIEISQRVVALCAALVATAPAQLPVGELPDRSEPVSFSKDVLPIFKRSCVACHNETKAKADLILETADATLKGSGDGAVVVPGKPDESLLFIVAAHLDDPVMPPENNKSNAPNLEPEELALLKLWINEGAKSDDASAADQPVEFATMSDEVDAIYSAAISPDNLYAAAGRGNRIHLYHLPTGRPIGELSDPALAEKGGAAHLDIVGSLAFGGNGLLASGGFRNVKLWRRAESALAAEFAPLVGEPAAVASNGEHAIVTDAAGGISLYRLSAPAEAPKSFKDHSAAVTGAGFAHDGRVVTASLDKTVKIRPAGGDGDIRQVAELPVPIHSLAIVDGGTRAACGCEDGIVRVVALDGEPSVVEMKGHEGAVTALVAFGEGAKRLLSGGKDAGLKVWDLNDPGAPILQGNNASPVVTATVSGDGKRVATLGEDKAARLWNGADLKIIKDLKTDGAPLRRQAESETALAVAGGVRDKRKAALDAANKKVGEEKEKAKKAADEVAKAVGELDAKLAALTTAESTKRRADEVVAVKTAAKAANLKPAQDAAKAAADALGKAQGEADAAGKKRTEAERNAELAVRFSKRAGEAAAAADAELAEAEAIVAAATGALEAAKKASGESSKGVTAVTVSADSSLVLASAEDGRVYSWATSDGADAGSFSASGGFAQMAPLPGGKFLAVGANKTVASYRAIPEWRLERNIGSIDDPEVFADRVNAVEFSPDGRRLATGGGVPSRGGELKIWRVRDGAELAADADEHSDAISSVSFSPDGRYVATAATDRFVKVFSSEDAGFARSFEGHTNHVLDVAWSADGLALASSGADNVVKLWDFEAGTQKKTVAGHSKPVTSVDFVGTGETLVSSSGDKTVRLGDKPLPDAGTFMHVAASSEDGKMIAAGGEDSILRIWSAADKKVLLKLD